jgi:hypothetical protein
MIPERQLYCVECREWYGEVFFEVVRSKNSCYGKANKQLRCIGCRLTRRTDDKNNGKRFLVKARSALLKHAPKFKKTGLIQAASELTDRFGWDIRNMAHDIEHAFKNGCPYCRRPFAEMANGLGDVTLDIIRPADDPFYTTNTKWCCMSCNRGKAKASPERWAAKLLYWAKWEKRQAILKAKPAFGTLFDFEVAS